jgi:hypothetical protein
MGIGRQSQFAAFRERGLATSVVCKLARAEAAAEVGKLEPDLINPLAKQRHGKADAVPGRDRLFLVA